MDERHVHPPRYGGGSVTICSVDGCERGVLAKGYCGRHYQQVRKRGTVHATTNDLTPSERFWAKADRSGACWEWTATIHKTGYGSFRYEGRIALAHRVAYELIKGPIPEGMQVDHTCRNRACVNPAHLRPVTNKQNQENVLGGRNPSGYRGVSWCRIHRKWKARARHNGRLHQAGYHSTAEEAAEAARSLRLSLYTHNDPDRTTPKQAFRNIEDAERKAA